MVINHNPGQPPFPGLLIPPCAEDEVAADLIGETAASLPDRVLADASRLLPGWTVP
jgi:hypothetical protein